MENSSMTPDVKWDLVAKHLAGESTEEEKIAFQAWLEEDVRNFQIYDKMKKAWMAKPQSTALPDADKVWNRLSQSIAQEKEFPLPKKTKAISIAPQFYRVAASIALILTFGILYFYAKENHLIQKLSFKVKETENGQATLLLSDGTIINLNKQSKIYYPEKFVDEKREIILEGEAFFEVKRDVSKPFIIHSNGSTTKVLGTSFNIRSDEDEGLVVVTVATGKVALYSHDSESAQVTLEPGDQGLFIKEKNHTSKSANKNANFLSWKTKVLTFNNKSLAEAIPNLEEFYDINIKVKNKSLLQCRFTTEFDHLELKDALRILQLTLGIESNLNGKNIQLEGKGCNDESQL